MKKGIDVSEWQDPSIIKEVMPDFCIIRAGYSHSEDTNVYENIRMCEQYHIPYGLYWYSYAKSPDQAESEAECLLDVASSCTPAVGLWYDIEDPSIPVVDYADLSKAFCERIAKEGYYVGIYASESKLPYLKGCEEFDKWVAYWGDNNGSIPSDKPKVGTLWQFTSKYRGMNLDGDVCHYDDMSFYNVHNSVDKVDKTELPEVVAELKRIVKKLEEML